MRSVCIQWSLSGVLVAAVVVNLFVNLLTYTKLKPERIMWLGLDMDSRSIGL